LSASVDISDKISNSTNNLGRLKNYHDDIYVPRNLARKFNLNHQTILNTDKNIPPWFSEILSKNILEARVSPLLPKIKSIYSEIINQRSNHIFLSGNVIEIVRIRAEAIKYEQSLVKHNAPSQLEFLLKVFGYNNNFVKKEISTWLNSIDLSLVREATPLDMFYWEQRMGNWGALISAEHDIAAEIICPFNCRLLLEICLKIPRK